MDCSILYGETQAVDDYVDLDDNDDDDVRSNEGYVRSIAAIHATSFRSSGLPAAKSTASKATKEELKSSCYSSENRNNQVNGVSDKDRELDTRNSQKNSQDYNGVESRSRTKHPGVKKLSHELDPPCSYAPPNTEGLSYIESQPPGDLSQANALDVVDNFLVVNYLGLSQVGLSQEVNTKKSSHMVKSLPISLAKGTQSLVKKTDRRSPIGKTGIFEWTDSLEADGGCEFFTKQTDSFFKRKDGSQKSHSHPPKSRYASFGLGYTGDNITNRPKMTNFTRSESRLNRISSLVTDEVLEAETRTKRNLFRDLNEQSNSNYLEPQLKVTDNGGGDGVRYEVGCDTQVAAKVMEAQAHGSLINKEINGADPTTGKFASMTTYSKAVLSRNPTFSSPNLNDVSNSTPIAHRTRRSKAASLSKMAGTEYGKDTNATLNVKTREASARDSKLVAGSSRSLKTKRKCSDIASVENAESVGEVMNCKKVHNIKDLHIEDVKVHSVKSSLTYPLRRRIRQTAPDKPNANEDLNNRLLSNDGKQPRNGKRKIRSTVKSTSEILGTAKSKRRSFYTHKASDIDGLNSDGENALPLSNMRTKSSLKSHSSSSASMLITRRRNDTANIRVFLSDHLDEDIAKQQKKIMGHLGFPLASSILDATHFVTDNFVRTRNTLEAMALGKQVVTHIWLESCEQAGCFIDEKSYILRDSKKETEIGFSMPVALACARQNPLLQGRRVYITPNAKPSREVCSSLVKAAGGQPLVRLGRSATKDDVLVLSCEEDYAHCILLLDKGVEVFSSELLLNGIVIQKLEFERHGLFLDHVIEGPDGRVVKMRRWQ